MELPSNPKRLKTDEDQSPSPSSSSEQIPPILKSDIDSLSEIFDYLSLRDLCSIGQTCKRLHRVAGEYFNLNYPLEVVTIESKDGEVLQTINDNGPCHTNFARFAQKVRISGSIVGLCEYIAENVNPKLHYIEFCAVNDWEEGNKASCIKPILKNLQVLSVRSCGEAFRDGFFDMLKDCSSLKVFMINIINGSDYDEGIWPWTQIPTLESLEMLYIDPDDMNKFLEFNYHIKKLSIDLNRVELVDAVDNLNDLSLDIYAHSECDDEIYNQLTIFKEEGRFKKLHVRINCYKDDVENENYENHLNNLQCANTLAFYSEEITAQTEFTPLKLVSLINLTELCIYVPSMAFDDFDRLARALINLEVLRLHNGSLENTMPFARRLSKLRRIEADKITSDAKFDISALNDERKKLREAAKLIICLHHDAYLKVRWESIVLEYDMVEIRRANKQCDRCW